MTGLYLAISVIVPIYILWRYYDASKAWKKVASDLNDYLGEDHPEQLKLLLVSMFEDTMKHTIIIRIAIRSLLRNKSNKSLPAISQRFSEISEEQEDRFSRLIVSMIFVNFRLSPLTYLFLVVLIALVNFISAVFSRSDETVDFVMKERSTSKYVENFANSIYKDKIAH
ncbi:hypothetical protein IFO68_17240 [Photobacterium sp. CAU 1568]|uniref:ABC transmembrane type-1 domain-containing protein n=1 Tax=Photobacterium arenosum TaxID=2774143 RepID=A0ABR9BPF3_9GAMM|nr:hypothetical protein [Photobacterium arenosum]MBD8514428.1 hypothetical protein [Photobacterium arenosum]